MRRLGRILGGIVIAALMLIGLAGVALMFGLQTQPGQNLAETAINRFAGPTVQVRGLSGRLTGLRLQNLEVRDADGAWLVADGVALDWRILQLLDRVVAVDLVQADRLQVLRRPAPSVQQASSGGESKPFELPVQADVARLHIAKLELGAPVLGAAAALEAEGRAHLASLQAGDAALNLRRLDGAGSYALTARLDPAAIDGKLEITEPDGGLLAHALSLPSLGQVGIAATVSGPRSALATDVAISAGPLRAAAKGTVDLIGEGADLTVSGSAPAMTPAPDVAWQSVELQARVHGPFTKPDASGTLRIAGLAGGGAELRELAAEAQGNSGQVSVHATAQGIRLPGPDPGLLDVAPIVLDATAQLDDPARPIRFSVAHPLVAAEGTAVTAGTMRADLALRLPELGKLAMLGGVDVQGNAVLQVHAAFPTTGPSVDVQGTVSITGGQAPLPGLLGDAAIAVSAQMQGDDLVLQRLALDGRTLHLTAQGRRAAGQLEAQAHVGLTELAVLAPSLSGSVEADAHVQGPPDRLALEASLAGEVGAPGVPRGPVRLKAALHDLPAAPNGTIRAEGTLAGAPLVLAVQARRDADVIHATIEQASWRSLQGEGALTYSPAARLPQGRVAVRMARLADLAPFLGQAVEGSVQATLELDSGSARLSAQAEGAGLGANRVGRATVEARVDDPLGRRRVQAEARLAGIEASGVAGSATLRATGPQDALTLDTTASLRLSGADADIAGAALLDATDKRVRLDRLQATARGETLRLLAPATIRFGPEVGVDRLRLGLREATLDLQGLVSPRLDATATLRSPAGLASLARPDLQLDGTVALDARLTGTPAQPGGTVRLAMTGVRMRTGPGRAMPAANVTANAQLAGKATRIDARLAAGSAQLAVNGQAPLGAGNLDLHATGGLDLRLLDPVLTANGRRARGRLSLDATVTGTAAAPRIAGGAQLADGQFQDFTQGVLLTDLTARVTAQGDTVRLQSLSGRAGPGTLAASGSVGVMAPGMPIDLALTLRNAQPLASDLLTANLDADLTLRGPAQGGLQAGGHILVRHADISIPERLPPTVAVLNVRRPGEQPPAPATPAAPVGLDLTLDAPQQIFVRGRGVDAEMGGSLRIRGTSTSPQVGGGLEMRRGSISLAGTTLDFSRGKVSFGGTGVSGKIDPTLDFAADSSAAGVTATLNITGFASQPKISLTSVPELPQDEVLAYLLFKRSAKELGPFQIAEIAAGLASLTGVGGGSDPLNAIRTGLGLDRLSVGTTSTTTNGTTTSTPTLEGGRYVANGVYVGAKQGTNGDTGATVQIDITKGLKLQTDVGTGQGGNQVGVVYQFEY